LRKKFCEFPHWPPFCDILLSKITVFIAVKLIRKNVSLKLLIILSRMTLYFRRHWNKTFFILLRMFLWHFVDPPARIECHVLFEWPLVTSSVFLNWIQNINYRVVVLNIRRTVAHKWWINSFLQPTKHILQSFNFIKTILFGFLYEFADDKADIV